MNTACLNIFPLCVDLATKSREGLKSDVAMVSKPGDFFAKHVERFQLEILKRCYPGGHHVLVAALREKLRFPMLTDRFIASVEQSNAIQM